MTIAFADAYMFWHKVRGEQPVFVQVERVNNSWARIQFAVLAVRVGRDGDWQRRHIITYEVT